MKALANLTSVALLVALMGMVLYLAFPGRICRWVMELEAYVYNAWKIIL